MTDVTDDPGWTSGDATLVSADGVRFKVASYYLFTASCVFRQAHAVSSGPLHLEFDDTSIESASTIRNFLNLIVHLRLHLEPAPTSAASAHSSSPRLSSTLHQADQLNALFRFLDKYDCPVLRRSAILVLDTLLPSSIDPAAALLAGCAADEPDLVSAALRFADRGKSDGHYEAPEAELALTAAKEDKDTLDPARMPYEFVRRIPQEYAWALARAWGGRPYPVRERFGEYIKAVKRYRSKE
ncbi:hypothetical protein CC85DRAFT_306041 [Cutaneotrichosporon oleaginosum]|uniref:BTB domain-containing protein n=1 Tax=Cutaneotrichosporon oleaginosum TaxID=879819 RepID=A0A0J0XB71_9TREE|nr:uncharacterized protein CC85DRAFT_306041 [Cutaneotrichosporon oleaginosum]KLT38362.1 hypothetical protein CC85DRAFT_306041 [Cutaneotrichosporon oleaginosum]